MTILATDDIQRICLIWYSVSEDDAGHIDIESVAAAPGLSAAEQMPDGMLNAINDWLCTEAGEQWILKQAEKQGAEIKVRG